MTEDQDQDGGRDEAPTSRRVGRIEWAMAALGGALVAGVFAMLIYEAAVYEDGPPVIVARIIDSRAGEGGHVVRFVAENQGPTTAAEVTIRGRIKRGDEVIEEAEVTIDYIARKSSREAGVIFERDPAQGSLDLKATSYRKP